MMRQVPRQCVHLHRQDRTDKYPDVACTTTVDLNIYENVYNYRRHVNNDFHYAVYDYFPRRPVNDYLHYGP